MDKKVEIEYFELTIEVSNYKLPSQKPLVDFFRTNYNVGDGFVEKKFSSIEKVENFLTILVKNINNQMKLNDKVILKEPTTLNDAKECFKYYHIAYQNEPKHLLGVHIMMNYQNFIIE